MVNEWVLANKLEGSCALESVPGWGAEPQVLGGSNQPLLRGGLWLSFFSLSFSLPLGKLAPPLYPISISSVLPSGDLMWHLCCSGSTEDPCCGEIEDFPEDTMLENITRPC